FGHQIGDAVLIGLAQIMQKHIRSTDVLGRWGGEEFMLILPNTSIAHAYEHMNRLRQRVEVADFSPVQQVTISVGLVSCTRFLCEKKLIELADNALYEAKENGRNRVELAPIVESTAQCDDVTHVAMLE
ncbi:MAG: GGDEF domain-containing protein, partial [Leucothrix sp.]